MVLFALLPTVEAACPDPAATVTDLEAAVAELRLEEVEPLVERFEGAVGCAWIEAPLLVRFWNAEGVWLHYEGDAAGAQASFAAARRLDTATFDANYGSKVRAVWESAASTGRSTLEVVPVPPAHSVRVDGDASPASVELDAGVHLVQVGREAPAYGALLVTLPDSSFRVETGLTVPAVGPEPAPAPVPDVGPEPEPRSRPERKKSPVLLVASGATALVGASFMAVAAVQQSSAIPNAPDLDALEAARRRQLAFGYSSYALLGLSAVGVGVHFAL